MTEHEFTKRIAAVGCVTIDTAKEIVASFAETAISEVKEVGVFELPGLGRLKKVQRKARVGRNPATGKEIRVPSKKVVKFTVAKLCKAVVLGEQPRKPRVKAELYDPKRILPAYRESYADRWDYPSVQIVQGGLPSSGKKR